MEITGVESLLPLPSRESDCAAWKSRSTVVEPPPPTAKPARTSTSSLARASGQSSDLPVHGARRVGGGAVRRPGGARVRRGGGFRARRLRSMPCVSGKIDELAGRSIEPAVGAAHPAALACRGSKGVGR
jgi:hypothetical protein